MWEGGLVEGERLFLSSRYWVSDAMTTSMYEQHWFHSKASYTGLQYQRQIERGLCHQQIVTNHLCSQIDRLYTTRIVKAPVYNVDPWGTPDFTGSGSESTPSTDTACVPSVR